MGLRALSAEKIAGIGALTPRAAIGAAMKESGK